MLISNLELDVLIEVSKLCKTRGYALTGEVLESLYKRTGRKHKVQTINTVLSRLYVKEWVRREKFETCLRYKWYLTYGIEKARMNLLSYILNGLYLGDKKQMLQELNNV